jgi:hypothetical protein
MPVLLFRQYVENLSTGKKQAVEDNTRGIETTSNDRMAKGFTSSPHEGDIGMETPYEVLVGLPARDLRRISQVCM